MFYVLGHFSKFILPGSRIIESSSSNLDVDVVAAITPNGHTVVVVHNRFFF